MLPIFLLSVYLFYFIATSTELLWPQQGYQFVYSETVLHAPWRGRVESGGLV